MSAPGQSTVFKYWFLIRVQHETAASIDFGMLYRALQAGWHRRQLLGHCTFQGVRRLIVLWWFVLCGALQRIRTRALANFERAFKDCDVIVTPATPSVAPSLPEQHNTTGGMQKRGY